MMKKEVLKTIKKNNLIEKDGHIIIGLSGGPDSVCLFSILLEIKDEYNLSIYPVHVNHKFRPGAAERDQEYVENLCKANGLLCKTIVADCNKIAEENKITSEEAGRQVRYKAFADEAERLISIGIPKEKIAIAVAQNLDDQAETILFRILRGTSTDGLGGIKYERFDEYGNKIIRPLLDISREKIEKYCEENNLNPCIDATNLEPLYTRNKIRLGLIPYIEDNFNLNIKETLVRMGKTATQDSDCLWNQAEAAFKKALVSMSKDAIILSNNYLKDLHPSILKRILIKGFNLLDLEEDIETIHLENCINIIESDNPSGKAELPKGYYAIREYENIKISKTESVQQDNTFITQKTLTMEEYENAKKVKGLYAAFDYDQLEKNFGPGFEERCILRTRKPGDYFFYKEGCEKKLQNYFVDGKIPKEDRDKIKLLAIGSEILWVILPEKTGRYTSEYKLCAKTKKAFFVELIRKI